MLAFPGMLIGAAKDAGMKVPENCDSFAPSEYPHFYVFCEVQLGAAMPYAGCHFDNARVVAEFSEDAVKKVTPAQLVHRGFAIGSVAP